jgi:hypothetical protein
MELPWLEIDIRHARTMSAVACPDQQPVVAVLITV